MADDLTGLLIVCSPSKKLFDRYLLITLALCAEEKKGDKSNANQ